MDFLGPGVVKIGCTELVLGSLRYSESGSVAIWIWISFLCGRSVLRVQMGGEK